MLQKGVTSHFIVEILREWQGLLNLMMLTTLAALRIDQVDFELESTIVLLPIARLSCKEVLLPPKDSTIMQSVGMTHTSRHSTSDSRPRRTVQYIFTRDISDRQGLLARALDIILEYFLQVCNQVICTQRQSVGVSDIKSQTRCHICSICLAFQPSF